MPDSQASKVDDPTLVKQAKSGDVGAFGTLYERYAADIYRFVRAQLPDSMEAEDLTSEVFFRAWGALWRYRERGYSFSAFLYKIARNALIDHWRKLGKEGSSPRLGMDEVTNPLVDPGERYAQEQEIQVLWRVLSTMREDYRAVLVLRFINGLTPREISPILGRSEGAVRVLQHRALAAIRVRLSTNEKDDDQGL